MPSLPLPYTLANGTLADATQVMADFNTLLNAINDGHITSLGIVTSGTWQGAKINLTYGGTNADLSATGPGVLKQAMLGAGVTVGPLSTSDISGLATVATSGSASDLSAGTLATARLPTVPIANGGTNATTAGAAFANIAVAASSISANGYIEYPNGLVDQWGKAVITTGNNSVSVTYPIPFPTAAFSVTFTGLLSPGNQIDYGLNAAPSTTGFMISCSSIAGANLDVYWRAVGN